MADINVSLGLDGSEALKAIERIAVLVEGVLGKTANIEVTADIDKATQSLSTVEDQAKKAAENSKKSFLDAFAGGALGGALGGVFSQIAGNVFSGIGDAIAGAQDFEQGLAGLSAVTGVTGAGLDDLGTRARELAKQFGGDANAQVASFQGILSKFGPQLAGTPEQLGKISENVNVLAKAAGLTADESMSALADAMLQFGVNVADADEAARESSRFINVLAASAQVGAAEVPQVAQAVLAAGVAAKGANVSFEETNAALQVLAVGGKVGSEAGVGLRNVLGLLQKQSGPGAKALKDMGLSVEGLASTLTTKGLNAALIELQGGINKLGSDAQKNATLMTLFGTENASTAGILLNGTQALAEFTEGVTGTNSATEQAAINMNTFGERISRLKANVQDGFISAFQTLAPIVSQLLDRILPQIVGGVTNLFSALAPTFAIVGQVVGGAVAGALIAFAAVLERIGEGFMLIKPIIPVIAVGIGVYAAATNAAAIASTLAAAKQAILNAVLSANPIGAVVLALTALVAGYAAVSDALTVTAEEQLEQAEAQKQSIELQIKDNKEKKQSVITTQGLVTQYKELASKSTLTAAEQKKLKDITQQLDKQYPSLIDQTKSFADNLKGVEEIGRQSSKAMEGLVQRGTELEKQLALANRAIVFAKRNVAIEELRDAFGGFGDQLSNILSSDGRNFVVSWRQARTVFENGLFSAKTEEQIDSAEAKILEFLNTNAKLLGDSKADLAIREKLAKAVEASRTALRLARGEAEAAADATGKQNKQQQEQAEAVEKADKDTKSLLQTQREIFEQKKRQLAAESEALETLRLKQILEGTLAKDEAARERAEREVEVQKQLAAAFLETFKVKQDADGVVVGVGIKIDEKDGNSRKVIADLAVEYQNILQSGLQARITLAGAADPKEALDFAKQSIKDINEAFKENSEKLAEGLIDQDAFTSTAENLADRLQNQIRILKTEIQTNVSVRTDTKLLKQYEEQIELLQNRLVSLPSDAADAIRKAQDETDKARIEANKIKIELLKDDAEANREEIEKLSRETLAIETQLKLRQIKATGELRDAEQKRILADADKQKKALDEQFGEPPSAMEKYAGKLNDKLVEAFKGLSEEAKKAREESLAVVQAEEEKLVESLKNGEIAFADYAAKLDELSARKAEIGEEPSFLDTITGAVKKTALDIAGDKIKTFKEDATKNLTELGKKGETSIEQLGVVIATTFGEDLINAAAAGELTLKGMLKSLADAAISALDFLIPVISGQFYGFLGPFALPLATIVIQGLKAALNSAISGAFRKGGRVRGGEQVIRINEEGEEFVTNARVTSKYGRFLDVLNRTNSIEQALTRSDLIKKLNLSKLGITFSDNTERGVIVAHAVATENKKTQRTLESMKRQMEIQSRQIEEQTQEIKALRDVARTTEMHTHVAIDKKAIEKAGLEELTRYSERW